jgi:TPR repeat protein
MRFQTSFGLVRWLRICGLFCCTLIATRDAMGQAATPATMPTLSASIAAESSEKCVPAEAAKLILLQERGVRVVPGSELERIDDGRRENAKAQEVIRDAQTSKKLSDARKWFEKGARKGYAPAQVNLAVAALAGWGGEPNAGTALYWLRQAAEQGLALAYFDLGVLYFNGCGVRQDYEQAFRYFLQGAEAGDAAAQVNAGYFLNQGLGTKRDDAAAFAWYKRAAEAGNAQGQYSAADMYLRGEGVAQDDAAAFRWFQEAAMRGHALARVMLGSMYAAGRGTAQDVRAAYLWMSAAEQQGETRATAYRVALEPRLSAKEIAELKEQARSMAQAARNSLQASLLQ